MKHVRQVIFGFLLLGVPLAAKAQFLFTTNTDGSLTLSGYTGPGGDVAIPSVTNGLPVTSIGDGVFSNFSTLTSIVIPNGVTNIGSYAFTYCSGLTNVTISDSVVNLGYSSFFLCTGLTELAIPDSVTNVEDMAFQACSGLTAVTIGSNVTSLGYQTFENCLSLTNIAIPDRVTSIKADMFADCSSLTSVSIGNGVTSIEQQAFYSCISLTNITLPKGLTNIGPQAFESCFQLTNITIPNHVICIGDDAFAVCTHFTGVYFEGNAPNPDSSAFADDNTTAYYLPGTTGWGTNYDGLPTAFWILPYPVILTSAPGIGVQNDQFSFTISWATNIPIVVETATSLSNPTWVPLQTNTLTNGSFYFSDPQWTNYSSRFYRVTAP